MLRSLRWSAVLGLLSLAGCQTDTCPPGVTDSIFCRGAADAAIDGCVSGATCNPADDLCAVGVQTCDARGATCEVRGRLAEGDPCDNGLYTCAADGTCTVCNDGAVCNTGNPCLSGRVDCASSAGVCVPDAPIDGQPCGTGGVCGGEVCSECIPNVICNTGNPCTTGRTTCTDPMTTVCEPSEDLPMGVGCGPGLGCNGSGACDVCNEGSICNTGNPCSTGHTDCGSGAPVCIADSDVMPGTGCGTGGVCSGAGECSECVDGTICNTGNPCTTGTRMCPMGVAVCAATSDVPEGVRCGVGRACDGSGVCSACVPGDPCVTATCETGVTDCSSGSPVCVPSGPAPAGAVCRPRADACDIEERCTGGGAACPPDRFAPSGGDCIDRGTCDGMGGCTPFCVPDSPCATANGCELGTTDCSTGVPVCVPAGPMANGTVCRAAVDQCDAPETCDGTALSCPGDVPLAAGLVCTGGVCDGMGACVACVQGAMCATGNPCEAGTFDCSGGAPMCNVAGPAAVGTPCRAPVGPCDLQEQCDGATTACPADSFDSTSVCRPPTHPCDGAETCNGSTAVCPPDIPAPAGTLCPGGVCDAVGTCGPCNPGASCNTGRPCELGMIDCMSGAPVCVAAGLVMAGVQCRAATLACDRPEMCTGSAPDCPPDTMLPAGTECRAVAGLCDLPEACDGSLPTCPPNAVQPAATVCRTAAGTCDNPEQCDGLGPACPPDIVVGAGTVCRAPTDVCDTAEACTGTGPACPIDLLRPAGAMCRMAVDICDVTENCTGAVAQCPTNTYSALGTVCPIGVCDGTGTCSNCGGICPSRANATTTCSGACGFTCLSGYQDCNTVEPDGCEIQTDTDVNNCSTCGSACPVRANAVRTCIGATCGFTCNATYDDCNAAPGDGCEVQISTSLTSCGFCGNVCPVRANATTTCVGGTCGFTCNGGFADCNGDPTDGCEINLNNDILHCGSCPMMCPARAQATTTCSAGTCGYTCDVTHGDCNGLSGDGCEITLATNLSNCGVCGNNCPSPPNSNRTCTTGSCGFTCVGGFQDCNGAGGDGCESFPASDLNNCGGCGNVCPTPPNSVRTCTGSCGYACLPGFVDCNGLPGDGCEINTTNDLSNCGSCGNNCPSPANSSRTCVASSCGYSCNGGFGDCDGSSANGCEAATGTDINNCGACGNACPNRPNSNRFCSASACGFACTGTFGDCNGAPADGCEVDISSSVSNCGACGNACNLPNAFEGCSGSNCTIVACSGGFYDVDTVPATGCECGDDATSNNCSSATSAGSMSSGSTTFDGKIVPNGVSDWYHVTFPPNTPLFGGGTASIAFDINDAGVFRFDVVMGSCAGGLQSCGSGGSAGGITDWSYTDNASPGFLTRNSSWPTDVYIRVHRISGGDSCLNYRLRISRL